MQGKCTDEVHGQPNSLDNQRNSLREKQELPSELLLLFKILVSTKLTFSYFVLLSLYNRTILCPISKITNLFINVVFLSQFHVFLFSPNIDIWVNCDWYPAKIAVIINVRWKL